MPLTPPTAAAILLCCLEALLPGLAVLRLLSIHPRDPGVRLGSAVAVGLALQPLAFLWAHLLHLPLGPWSAWSALLLGALVAWMPAAWIPVGWTRRLRGWGKRGEGWPGEVVESGESDGPRRSRWRRDLTGAHFALLAFFLTVLAARWYAARYLTIPLWGDSLHHTMIVRLFTLHGGLVDNWLPFVPLSTFTYHFGFHAMVANVVWLTGLPEPQGVLVTGQVLMALQVLTVYALAAGLTGRPWAGFGAALAAGGLSPMPGYYLNWGRYTQLAGQVILPVAGLAAVWAARGGMPSVGRRRSRGGAEGRPDPAKSEAEAGMEESGQGRVGRGPGLPGGGIIESGLHRGPGSPGEGIDASGLHRGPGSPGEGINASGLHRGPGSPGEGINASGLHRGPGSPGEGINASGLHRGPGSPGELIRGLNKVMSTEVDSISSPLNGSSSAWHRWLLAAILLSGLALTHYLVAAFYAVLVAAWWCVGDERAGSGLATSNHQPRATAPRLPWRLTALGPLLVVALLTALLCLPWLPQLNAGQLGVIAAAQVSASKPAEVFGVVQPVSVWGDLGRLDQNVGLGLLSALVLALVAMMSVVRGLRLAALGAVWTALLLVCVYPGAFGLPFHGLLKDFTVAIALYLPLGLVIGGALGRTMEAIWGEVGSGREGDRGEDRGDADGAPSRESVPRQPWRLALTALLAVCGMAVAWADREALDGVYARTVPIQSMYVTPADQRAMTWIQANTPKTAVFLVSSAFAFGNTVLAGDDAGWWIPLLADRKTTLPPITYGLERSFEPGYRLEVNHLIELWQKDPEGDATLAALRAAGVTYAYVGPTAKALDRRQLEASRNWQRVYSADGAAVFVMKGGG